MVFIEGLANAIPGLNAAIGLARSMGSAPAGGSGLPFDTKALLEKQHGISAQQLQNVAVGSQDFLKPSTSTGGGSKKKDDSARQIANEIAQAWQQANLARIQGDEQTNAALLDAGQRTLDEFAEQARSLESQRYEIEVAGLKKREEADKGNAVALARDKAQEAVIVQQHINRMAAIETQYAAKQRQAAATELGYFIKAEDVKLARAERVFDKQFEAGRISVQDRARLEEDFTLKIQKEVLAQFDAVHAGLKEGTEDYKRAMAERAAIVAGFGGKIETIEDRLLQEEAAKWKTFSSEVRSSFNGALDQLIIHGGTFEEFMRSSVLGVAQAFLHAGATIVEDWVTNQIKMMLAQDTTVAHAVAGEATKTGAVATSQATQVGIVAAGSGAKNVVEATADSKSILNSAYTAAASAYKSIMQSVPPPLNLVLAPIGAAGVFAAVAAFDLISAEGGLERVKYNGQLIRAHVDEAVMPARIARPLLNLAESGGFDRITNNGGDINLNFPLKINGSIGHKQDFEDTLRLHRAAVHRWARNEARNGHFRKLLSR